MHAATAVGYQKHALSGAAVMKSEVYANAGAYKIPAVSDVPLDLRVTVLDPSCGQDGSYRPPNLVHSSKNTGEAPLFLGSAIFFAIKQAVYAARQDHGKQGFFLLDSPLSSERLRMACIDEICQGLSGAAPISGVSC